MNLNDIRKGDGDGTTDCKSGGTAMDRAALD